MPAKMKKELSKNEKADLLKTLKERFEQNSNRHKKLEWSKLNAKLEAAPEKLQTLSEMEKTGGEPDVVDYDKSTDEYIFIDCAKESPIGRRSLCYDRAALDARKTNKPKNSAIDLANEMGIEVLTEAMYRKYQKLVGFDTKTSSWVITPAKIRELGGAIFCDYRYDCVFVYHNGAESYYASRGFRGKLTV